jgi:hypothetical protein
MMKNLMRAGGALALASVAACGDVAMVNPAMTPASRSSARSGLDATLSTPLSTLAASTSDEVATVSSHLARLNDELAASGSNMRYIKAELLMDGHLYDGRASTLVIADDRYRGIGGEWVPGDPRREGRVGVNYAVLQNLQPRTRQPDGTGVALVPFAQLNAQIEEGMAAWRNQSCSAPITPLSATDKSVDIVQFGWYPKEQFWAFADGDTVSGNSIIGITLSSGFLTPDKKFFTDIDRNGKADLSRSQVLYNNRFAWGNNGAANVVDFYSIITHETGHALGLGHFGKVFVTKHDLADGSISIDDIKYAPLAIMNAVYVTGRGEIAGTDHSSFCQIWSSAK